MANGNVNILMEEDSTGNNKIDNATIRLEDTNVHSKSTRKEP